MTGYVRTDTADNIANNKIANADDLDNEFNAIQAGFNASTGHVHDGTTGNGAPITKVGPAQDLIVSATTVLPKTTNTLDIGSSSVKFKDIYIDGVGYLDAAVLTTADINGGTVDGAVIGGTTPAAITGTTITGTSFVGPITGSVTGNVTGNLTGNVTSSGTSTFATVDINGGAIDGTAIGAAVASSGAFTTLAASGAATLGSTLAVTGAVTLSSTLGVTGTITGNVTGNVTGNLTGTASNATTAVTLTGLTSSIIELNKLTGVTASTAEINKLAGLTASTAELNKLAGTPAGLTSTELGYVDGVTSAIQTQIDSKVALAGSDLTGGFTSSSDNDGTASGTYTPTPSGGNFKTITNNGAFTFAAPSVSGSYSLVVEITNGASAGTVTFSGFARVFGDLLTTTNGHKFQVIITKTAGGVTASRVAMQ
jgi:hypothetical protein